MSKFLPQLIRQFLVLTVALCAAATFTAVAAAWTGPTQSPPDGNPPPPLNTSNTSQTKSGSLYVTQSADWTSIYGQGSHIGVVGRGTDVGLQGETTNGAGVVGLSTTWAGTYGRGPIGLFGESPSTGSTWGSGVHGVADDGTNGYGGTFYGSNVGVYADAVGAGVYGVWSPDKINAEAGFCIQGNCITSWSQAGGGGNPVWLWNGQAGGSSGDWQQDITLSGSIANYTTLVFVVTGPAWERNIITLPRSYFVTDYNSRHCANVFTGNDSGYGCVQYLNNTTIRASGYRYGKLLTVIGV